MTKYLDEDIKFHNPVVELYDSLAYVQTFSQNKKLAYRFACHTFDSYQLLKNFSPASQKVALQHMIISEKMKFELDKLGKFDCTQNSATITSVYNKVMYELSHDVSYIKFIKRFKMPDNFINPLCADTSDAFYLNEQKKAVLNKFYTYE